MRGWEGEKKGRGVRVKRGEERKKGLGPATVRTNACGPDTNEEASNTNVPPT